MAAKTFDRRTSYGACRGTYASLFVNWQGVMIGDGDVWFQGIGDKLEVKIFAVNN
jgi:hypothetical protein